MLFPYSNSFHVSHYSKELRNDFSESNMRFVQLYRSGEFPGLFSGMVGILLFESFLLNFDHSLLKDANVRQGDAMNGNTCATSYTQLK